ncbi:adenosylcobyric acid synthase (glutamine-hydrolysing) [Ornithinimicrobium humiphilum]|uniref:Cobyric acid synthase n=2 Tax=Ornithinimicrobium humiphilum TaxID=125288 RepID=A0A543K6W5_9MICO|nr:adenosylcobyric acid synthase (glutamine-hydrolysing) [Ornithinimicrobium humiphilum]
MAGEAAARRSSTTRGAVMVVGTTSGSGKSTVVASLCRALARRGVRVAPFKAQNMSNHAAVTPDGGEIGRSQAMQALAAGVETDRRMGPVLLKPSANGTSHVVVMGEEIAVDDALSYGDRAETVRPVVLDALASLRQEHDVVVLEGAGGAAEINLLERDVVNLPLAAAAGVPAVLVVDIDRGGSFASAYGTWALLPEHLRSTLRGFVLNGFRGDASLLADGLADLERRTGVPVLGVLPHLGDHLMLGVEDSLDLVGFRLPVPQVTDPVRVAVVRLPHLANPSDLDPLLLEPSVEVRWATRPGDLEDADLVVLPGSRATVADLAWLRERDLDRALTTLDRRVRLFGLCAGYQMLGTLIHDDLESGAGTVEGLGLLPVETTFERPKVVTRSRGRVVGTEIPVEGYQIRWGRLTRTGGHALFELEQEDGTTVQEGCVTDRHIRGTSLHGVFDCDRLRHALLWKVAAARRRTFVPSPTSYAEALSAHVDHLADWVEEHLDLDSVLELAGQASAPGQEPGW